MNNFVDTLTKDQLADLLAQYLPNGKAMLAKNIKTTNLYKLLKSLNTEEGLIRDKLNEILCEYNINITNDYLSEYETALGIPDHCFSTSEATDRRRNQVIAKMRAIGTQTCADLVAIIKILGIDIRCATGFECGIFPVSFPWCFFGSTSDAAQTLYITFINFSDANLFPVSFPWFFSGESYIERVKCFIETLIPANCRVFYAFDQSNTFDLQLQNGDNLITQDGNDVIIIN